MAFFLFPGKKRLPKELKKLGVLKDCVSCIVMFKPSSDFSMKAVGEKLTINVPKPEGKTLCCQPIMGVVLKVWNIPHV